jgi:hypothetical protein
MPEAHQRTRTLDKINTDECAQLFHVLCVLLFWCYISTDIRPKTQLKMKKSAAATTSSHNNKAGSGGREDGEDESDDEEAALAASLAKMGYCHFNEDGSKTTFDISLFGTDLVIVQNPASRSLGHGAVVWDASVILTKYMEHSPRGFSTSDLLGKSVLELGSGCGLGGIAYMMV